MLSVTMQADIFVIVDLRVEGAGAGACVQRRKCCLRACDGSFRATSASQLALILLPLSYNRKWLDSY